jgi:hypothetical protein
MVKHQLGGCTSISSDQHPCRNQVARNKRADETSVESKRDRIQGNCLYGKDMSQGSAKAMKSGYLSP